MQLEKLIKVCTIGLILVAMMAGCTVNQTAPPITMTQPESEIVEPSEDMQNQDGTIEVEPGNHDSKEEATVALASPTDVTQEPELSVDETIEISQMEDVAPTEQAEVPIEVVTPPVAIEQKEKSDDSLHVIETVQPPVEVIEEAPANVIASPVTTEQTEENETPLVIAETIRTPDEVPVEVPEKVIASPVTTEQTEENETPLVIAEAIRTPDEVPVEVPEKVLDSESTIEHTKKNEDHPPVAEKKEPPMDVEALEARLRETKAIGLFTKLALKNQIDDLMKQFGEYHQGVKKISINSLRQSYDMLVLKMLAVIQDGDPPLANTILSSREAIWKILSDREKFKTLA